MLEVKKYLKLLFLITILVAKTTYAAISVDKSRIIFDENKSTISLNVSNESGYNYLIQSWVENKSFEKDHSSFVLLPPIQRLDAKQKSKLILKKMSTESLRNDRESLFYFNLREIPPDLRSNNKLILTVQTRIKIIYRPQSLFYNPQNRTSPSIKDITFVDKGKELIIKNTGPYYVTMVNIERDDGFSLDKPIMIAPYSEHLLSMNIINGDMVVSIVNDFGAKEKFVFKCNRGNPCEYFKSK